MNVPLVESLREAAQTRWSGLLRVSDETDQVGSIVLHEGRLAWATAKDQEEDLSGFLQRVAAVDEAKASEIRRRYQTPGRLRQLVELLDGDLTPEELRRYLLLHLRSVSFHLLSRGGLSTSATNGTLEAERSMTFSWDELLVEGSDGSFTVRPSWFQRHLAAGAGATLPGQGRESSGRRREVPDQGRAPARSGAAGAKEGGALRRLAQLRGYRGAMVVSARGAIHAVHGLDGPESERVARAATVLLGAQRNVEGLVGAGAAEATLIEGSRGSITLRWLDDSRRLAVVVLLDERGRVGVLREKLERSVESLLAEVGEGATKSRGEA